MFIGKAKELSKELLGPTGEGWGKLEGAIEAKSGENNLHSMSAGV